MKLKNTFAHLGFRWGGQVLLFPRCGFICSRNFKTSMLLLSLILFILFPAAAQDATPTQDIIVTAVPPDVSVVVPTGSTIDTSVVIAGMAVFAIVSLGSTALVAYLVKLLGNSVKTEQMQGLVDSLQKWMYNQAVLAAGRTPQQWDDSLVPALANFVGYNPAVGTPVRIPSAPPSIPPAPSVPPRTEFVATTEFMDIFGKRGDNSYTWTGKGHDPAVIEIPDGYDYVCNGVDGNGTPYPWKAVNTNEEYGTRLNVSSNAGKHHFSRKQRIMLGAGTHEIALSYIADVKHDENQNPMNNWVWTEAYLDGQPVIPGPGTVNHMALQNGAHVATWRFNNSMPREVLLSFTVTVHWGSAEGNSTIDLKAFGLKKAQAVG